jgi:hypothetical protein
MSGTGFVYIAPGASLELYVAGPLSVSGTGIINGDGGTDKLTIFGLNTSLTAAYSGSSTFVGSMNMPYAALSLSGTAGLYGSFTANSITVNGSSAVHIDEALGATPGNGYVVLNWNELAPNASLY